MTVVENNEFGVNLWWSVPSFVVDGERAQNILIKHGFEKEDLPLPSRRKVVSRAAYSFQDRRRSSGRRVTEKTRDSESYVTYGILNQKRRGSEEVGYDQSTTIRLDKDSGRVQADGPLSESFFSELRRYEDAVTEEDVREFLKKVVDMCYGIKKRPSGGIYFIPDRFVGIIESAQSALDELKVGAELFVERVVNGEQERSIVWNAVENDIDSEIDKVLNAVEKIEKRAANVQSHESKLKELDGLMDIYRGLLGQEAQYEELAEKLEDASNTVAEKLGKLQKLAENKPQPETAGDGYKRSKIKVDPVPTAIEVLKESGESLYYGDIADKVRAKGIELRATKTKSEEEWLLLQINKAVSNGAPLEKVARGTYRYAS